MLKKQTSNYLTSLALPALPPSRGTPHRAPLPLSPPPPRVRRRHWQRPPRPPRTRRPSRSRTPTPTLESATNAGGAPPRHASEPTYGELVSLSALRKVPGHLGRECQPSWLGRRGRVRTKKVAARVCTRRAPSHTVQSCVSGPFGALEPNGAYSGGAPHRQVAPSQPRRDLRRRARPGCEAALSDRATRCAAAHHALDHRSAAATATAAAAAATATAARPPPHGRTAARPHGTLPRISGAARVAGAGLPETLRWRRTPQQPPLSYGCQNLDWSN